jgi:hypothetical protein
MMMMMSLAYQNVTTSLSGIKETQVTQQTKSQGTQSKET